MKVERMREYKEFLGRLCWLRCRTGVSGGLEDADDV